MPKNWVISAWKKDGATFIPAESYQLEDSTEDQVEIFASGVWIGVAMFANPADVEVRIYEQADEMHQYHYARLYGGFAPMTPVLEHLERSGKVKV